MYDNSETKTGRQPDYVCKDPQCRKGVWISNTERNAAEGTAPAQGTVANPAPKKILVIDKAMELSLKAAHTLLTEHLGKLGETATEDDYSERTAYRVQIACAMFTARTQGRPGVFKAEKEALATAQQQRVEAERRRRETEEANRRAAEAAQASSGGYQTGQDWDMTEQGDDDLPF